MSSIQHWSISVARLFIEWALTWLDATLSVPSSSNKRWTVFCLASAGGWVEAIVSSMTCVSTCFDSHRYETVPIRNSTNNGGLGVYYWELEWRQKVFENVQKWGHLMFKHSLSIIHTVIKYFLFIFNQIITSKLCIWFKFEEINRSNRSESMWESNL